MFSWYLFNVFIDKVVRMDKSNFSYLSNVEDECCYSSAIWYHVTITILTNISYLQLVTSYIRYFQYYFPLFSITFNFTCTVRQFYSALFDRSSDVRWFVVRRHTGFDWLCYIVQLSHWSPYFMWRQQDDVAQFQQINLTSCQAVKFKFRPPPTHFSTTKSRWETMLIYYLPTYWIPYKWLS